MREENCQVVACKDKESLMETHEHDKKPCSMCVCANI